MPAPDRGILSQAVVVSPHLRPLGIPALQPQAPSECIVTECLRSTCQVQQSGVWWEARRRGRHPQLGGLLLRRRHPDTHRRRERQRRGRCRPPQRERHPPGLQRPHCV